MAQINSKKNIKKKKKINDYKKRPFTALVRLFLTIAFIGTFAVAGIIIGLYMAVIDSAPALELVAIEPDTYTSIIYDSYGNEIDRLHGDENREYVKLEEIPVNLQHALIAIEDSRFYVHDGIDVKSILRAAYSTLSGKRLEGASTITQQLIKNNVTQQTRNNIYTKIQEQYLAESYEKELANKLGSKEAAKNYILELYLNTIALGHGFNGVQAAANGYFNKDVSELTLSECAVLAGITNSPTRYSPRLNPENNKDRQHIILNYMLEQEYITPEEKTEAENDDVYSRIYSSSVDNSELTSSTSTIHSYFVDALFDQISQDLQNKYNMSATQANYIIYNAGLEITSTIDTNMQKIVDAEYLNESNFPTNIKYKLEATYVVSIEDSTTGTQEHKSFTELCTSQEAAEQWVQTKRSEIEAGLSSTQTIVADRSSFSLEPQSAMVIMDYKTGEIKAIAGSRGAKTVNRGFNRAVDAERQPGSVFKVLAAYSAGINTGKLTASTIIRDEPYTYNGYTPKNWYGERSYRGDVTVRTAIRDSMNIIAVKAMIENTGMNEALNYLENFGFTTIDDIYPSTALGGLTTGVTQVELAGAYGTIANGGEYRRPMFYTMVKDHSGNILLENNYEPKQVLNSGAAYVLTDMMRDVVKSGTGTAAKFVNSKMPVVGKTGTTTKAKDLTFVGYTPYYVASIWLGYDNYDKGKGVDNMDNINQQTHLKLWRKIMEKIHQDLPVKDFDMPEDVTKLWVCKTSGMRANSGCSSYEEVFVKGTEPDYCNGHYKYKNNTEKSDKDAEDTNEENANTDEPDNNSSSESTSPATDNNNNNYTNSDQGYESNVADPGSQSEPAIEDIIVEPTVS